MKISIIITAIMLGFITDAVAQSNKEDIDIIQSVYGKNKKELVSGYIQLPSSQRAAFWKLYDQYESERKALGRKRIILIEKYIDEYDHLNNAKAASLTQDLMANTLEHDRFMQSWFPRFSAVTGAKNAAKFYQLETYLQTIVRLEIMEDVPFIGELKKKKK